MKKNKEERLGLLDDNKGYINHKRNSYWFFMLHKSTNTSNEIVNYHEVVKEEQCGWYCYAPDFIQRFNTIHWAIFFLALGALIQGITVNGLLHYVISTIERRFSLRSTEMGLISGSYDFASLLFLIPVTYFGGRPKSYKPKWIGFGLIILGIGSFIFALPYFMAPQAKVENPESSFLCQSSSKYGLTAEFPNQKEEQLSQYMWIFFIGNFLHGVGATPLYTLAITYIDENVTRKKSSLFLGIFYSLATMGPAVGFIFGGYLLQLHEDFWKFDSAKSGLTPISKAWVGAWWIGFIFCSLTFFITAIPVLALPAKLSGWLYVKTSRISEVVIKIYRTKPYEHFSELPKAMCELLTNYSFLFINLAGCCEGIIISGSGAFMPKIIQTQFHISSKATAYVMGIVTVPSAVMGTMVGGGIIKKFDLKFKGILKLCMCTAVLAMLSTSGFLFVCPNERFAGVNVPYTDEVVYHDQRSLAMGTQWMMVRLIGMVPGPIVFGLLLDDACTHWLNTCEDEGACFMYDHYLISRYMVVLGYGWKSLELIFLSLSLWCYNRSLSQRLASEEFRRSY